MKSIMKRLLTLVLVLTLAFTMTSCDIVFEILDAFLSEEDGDFGDIGGTGEKVEVDVLADTGREKDPENPYSSLHSGYNFTPASGEDKIWKVESLKDIDRAFDYAIANCQATVYMDFANVLDGYKKIDDFFKNEYLPNAQKELGYITGYQYSYKGTVVLFTLKYNNNAASFILDKTDENSYENYKNGNMIIRDEKDGGPTRSASFDDFAINKNNNGTMAVYNSEALWWALEHNYLPTFPEKNTKAEAFYNEAKDILREIINDDMTDYEKTLAIFEYLVDRVDYDYDAFEAPFDEKANDNVCYYLEGVFEYNRAVCDGKSKAFVLLCRMEGIEALRDWGDSYFQGRAGHAWNYVKLDGTWYMVDTTAGDAGIIFDKGARKAEVVDYSYFLCDVNTYKTSIFDDERYKYSGVWDSILLENNNNADISSLYYDKIDVWFDEIHPSSNRDFLVTNEFEMNYLVYVLAPKMEGTTDCYTLKIGYDESVTVEEMYGLMTKAANRNNVNAVLYDYTKEGYYLIILTDK